MIDDITRKVRNTKISSSTTEEEPEVKMGIVELSSMSADQLSEHISKMDIKDVKSLFKKRK
jgi:CCR4-NOT transcriptional regulation complex NOT5 subunit